MKKLFTQSNRNGDLYTSRIVALVAIVFMICSTGKAQYFTKITTGTLVSTPKVSYSASFADYNNDGWDDMIILDYDGLKKTSLFVNNGDGTFSADTLNTIFTTSSVSSIACAWGDYNNDGNVDLYICRTANGGAGTSQNYLFRNDGNGIWTRITDGNIVTDEGWSMGAAWADYDNDGFLDLYVVNWQTPNALYHNNGDGTFTKITSGAPVTDNTASYSCSWCDYDNDGYQDLFVVNYYISLPPQNDCLYHNNGDGTFTKDTLSLIANDNAMTQGSSWGDFNNDGLMDLYVTNNDWYTIKHNFLYKNNGNGNFSLVSASPSTDAGAAFGSGWLDFNNDGYLDLSVSINGSTSAKRKNFLYLNNGNETFTNQITDITTTDAIRDYCTTISDYDHNGYPDIFNPSYSATLQHGLYKNNGGTKNYLTLRLQGVVSNRSAIGARIRCYAGGMAQTREIQSATGMYGGSTFAQTFGLGANTVVDSITINWPSGIHQVILNPVINQILNVTEETPATNRTLNVKVFLQSLYTGTGTMAKAQGASGDEFPGTTADQITIELHDAANYSTIVHSVSNVNLSTTGDASVTIPAALNGNYYIAIKHRNSIETVSATPISFSSNTTTFNFDALSKAFGNNLYGVGSDYLIYGGDNNQDGLVDSSDMIATDNDVTAFATGYLVTDVNGDGLVDSSDMILIDNNASAFISSVLP